MKHKNVVVVLLAIFLLNYDVFVVATKRKNIQQAQKQVNNAVPAVAINQSDITITDRGNTITVFCSEEGVSNSKVLLPANFIDDMRWTKHVHNKKIDINDLFHSYPIEVDQACAQLGYCVITNVTKDKSRKNFWKKQTGQEGVKKLEQIELAAPGKINSFVGEFEMTVITDGKIKVCEHRFFNIKKHPHVNKKIKCLLEQATVASQPQSIGAEKALSQQLFEMCNRGDIVGIARLIASGFNINSNDAYIDGSNVLHKACELGNEKLVRFLVEHDANIFVKNGNGLSPRDIAAMHGYNKIVNYLDNIAISLRSGSVPVIEQIKTVAFTGTPAQQLFEMCRLGDIAGIARLIASGFNINSNDAYVNGSNVLHKACELGNEKLVRFLVEHDANIFVKNGNGLSPRDIAAMHGYNKIVNYLDNIAASLKIDLAKASV